MFSKSAQGFINHVVSDATPSSDVQEDVKSWDEENETETSTVDGLVPVIRAFVLSISNFCVLGGVSKARGAKSLSSDVKSSSLHFLHPETSWKYLNFVSDFLLSLVFLS